MKGSVGVVAALLAVSTITGMGQANGRELYDARILGEVPQGDRSYIEGIAFDGTEVFAGSAFGSTGTLLPLTNLGVPSRIFS